MKAKANRKYQTLRGDLVKKGFSVRAWAIANGYRPTTVYMAAQGLRNGVQAVKILNHLKGAING